MEAFAGDERPVPEQVWDAPTFPSASSSAARPSGSAHAAGLGARRVLKLCRSLRDGRVFDLPPQTVQRYLAGTARTSPYGRFNNKMRTMAAGRILRIETLAPATSSSAWPATARNGIGQFLGRSTTTR